MVKKGHLKRNGESTIFIDEREIRLKNSINTVKIGVGRRGRVKQLRQANIHGVLDFKARKDIGKVKETHSS